MPKKVDSLFYTLTKHIYIYIYIYIYHKHQIALLALIFTYLSLSLSPSSPFVHHRFLSGIACPHKAVLEENVTYKFVLASPAVSHVSCPSYLMGGKWPHTYCFAGCFFLTDEMHKEKAWRDIYIYIYIYACVFVSMILHGICYEQIHIWLN